MRGFLLLLFILILTAGMLLFVFREPILKAAVAQAVSSLTGFDTSVRALNLNLKQGVLHVEGLTLLNPESFEGRVFADIPEIHVSIDLGAILKKEKIHLRELRLSMKEIHIEKNTQGVSNISRLASVAEARRGGAKPEAEKKPGLPFYLDRFELTLRKVSLNDRSGVIPKKIAVDMKIEKQVFEGITDPKSIVNLILMKILTESTFANLGVNPADIKQSIVQTVGQTFEFAKDAGAEAETVVKGTVEEAKATWTDFQETTKNVTGGIVSFLKKKMEGDQPATRS
jgi:hypothetical protein